MILEQTDCCTLCSEAFNEETKPPHVLLCGHSFCKADILNVINDGVMKCPICAVTIHVDCYPQRFPPLNLLLLFNIKKRVILSESFLKGILYCAECNLRPITYRCSDCNSHYCAECDFLIHSHRVFASHNRFLSYKGDNQLQDSSKPISREILELQLAKTSLQPQIANMRYNLQQKVNNKNRIEEKKYSVIGEMKSSFNLVREALQIQEQNFTSQIQDYFDRKKISCYEDIQSYGSCMNEIEIACNEYNHLLEVMATISDTSNSFLRVVSSDVVESNRDEQKQPVDVKGMGGSYGDGGNNSGEAADANTCRPADQSLLGKEISRVKDILRRHISTESDGSTLPSTTNTRRSDNQSLPVDPCKGMQDRFTFLQLHGETLGQVIDAIHRMRLGPEFLDENAKMNQRNDTPLHAATDSMVFGIASAMPVASPVCEMTPIYVTATAESPHANASIHSQRQEQHLNVPAQDISEDTFFRSHLGGARLMHTTRVHQPQTGDGVPGHQQPQPPPNGHVSLSRYGMTLKGTVCKNCLKVGGRCAQHPI